MVPTAIWNLELRSGSAQSDLAIVEGAKKEVRMRTSGNQKMLGSILGAVAPRSN